MPYLEICFLFGSMLILVVCVNAYKTRKFDNKGNIAIIIGALMTIIPIIEKFGIISQIYLTRTPGGTITVSAEIQNQAFQQADENFRLSIIEQKLNELLGIISISNLDIRASYESTSISGEASEIEIEEYPQGKSLYTVLVFYKSQNYSIAEEMSKTILSYGYRSSATLTSLKEARKQFSEGQAWVIYSDRGEGILPEVKSLLIEFYGSAIDFVFKPMPSKLVKGDIQILLF